MDPELELSPEAQSLRDQVTQFVAAELAPLDLHEREWADDPHDRIPWAVIEAAHDTGLTDLTVPTEFGGRDATSLEVALAVEALASGDLGVAAMLENNYSNVRTIDRTAQADVREAFFERYASEPRHVIANAASEPRNGSNGALPYEHGTYDTTAVRDGDEWVIDGTKRYITNGAEAGTIIVHAQTDPSVPHHDGGSTAFLVHDDADGLSVTEVHEKFSQRTINNATLAFDGVRVPDRNVLGEVGRGMQTGESWRRHIEVGAIALGAARGALESAVAFAETREQAGSPIVDHQAIAHTLADMATDLQAARALVWTAARAADRQQSFDRALSSMAKLHATDVSVEVTQDALEIFGGAGIMLETPVQKYFRDCVSYFHSDGTQEVHRETVVDGLRNSP